MRDLRRFLGDVAKGQRFLPTVGVNQDFEKAFAVEELPPGNGLTWLAARPKAADSGLESVRIGFNKGMLQKLEFADSFGQRTVISVSKFEKNPPLGADEFKFTPPKGADVIGG